MWSKNEFNFSFFEYKISKAKQNPKARYTFLSHPLHLPLDIFVQWVRCIVYRIERNIDVFLNFERIEPSWKEKNM